MKRFALLPVVILLITVCLSALPVRSADSKNQAQDEQSVNKHDAHAFSMAFHEDADFTNVIGMSAHGRKAIEEFHRPLFEGDGSQGVPSFKHAVFKVLDTHIRFLRPDVASVDVTWSQTGGVFNGKDMGARRGLLMWVVTKERGVWGISVMHNMDLPVAPAKAE